MCLAWKKFSGMYYGDNILKFILPRNANMRTYFVFSCVYAIYFDVGRFRGSNKRWILFIYTHKHVIIVVEYSPIKGAKMHIQCCGRCLVAVSTTITLIFASYLPYSSLRSITLMLSCSSSSFLNNPVCWISVIEVYQRRARHLVISHQLGKTGTIRYSI
jgi:hypothetical protein